MNCRRHYHKGTVKLRESEWDKRMDILKARQASHIRERESLFFPQDVAGTVIVRPPDQGQLAAASVPGKSGHHTQ